MSPPDWNTKAGYDSVYYGSPEWDGRPNAALRPRVRLNYVRYIGYREAQQYADFYTTITEPTDSMVVIGSGFAWSLEVLVDQYGYNPSLLTGVDTSGYVQGNKGGTEEQEIRDAITAVGLDPDDPNHVHPLTGEVGRGKVLFDRCYTDTRPRASIQVLDESLSNNGSRNRVVNAVGGSVDFIISELMLESLTDGQAQVASSQAHQADGAAQVYHLVIDRMPQAAIDEHGWNIHTLEEWKALIPADTFVSAIDFRVV